MKKLILFTIICLSCLCLYVSASAEEYLYKEDFNTAPSNTWYTSNSCESTTSNVIDTDGDGAKDSMYHSGPNHLATKPTKTISFTAGQEIMVQTRVKYAPRPEANLLNPDNSIMGNGDGNNGSLMHFKMPGSYWLRMKVNTEGYLTYGDTAGDGVVTDYKLYADEWYTITYKIDSTRKKYSLSITTDDGRCYSGPVIYNSYGGGVMTGVGVLTYGYGWYYRSTVDYLYIWDNAPLDEVTGKYLNKFDLNGATNLDPTDELSVTFTFENPVTERDLKKIYATNGAILTKKLSADGCSATIDISGLDYEKTYSLEIPRIGNNKAGCYTFSTKENPPESVFKEVFFEESKIVSTMPVTANITYESYKPDDILVMIVFYNEKNQVTRSVSFVSTTGKFGEETIRMQATPKNTDVKAKVFVWNRFDTMKPLAPMAEINQ